MGESHKYDFLPDPAAAFSGGEEGMARRLEEDNVLEYREEEVREAAHKKLWTQVSQALSASLPLSYYIFGTGTIVVNTDLRGSRQFFRIRIEMIRPLEK